MKLITFCTEDKPRVGIMTKWGILDIPAMLISQESLQPDEVPGWAYEMVSLIENSSVVMPRLTSLVTRAHATTGVQRSPYVLGPEQATVLAPIPRPRKNVFCVGLNYQSHAREGAAKAGRAPDPPEYPTFFSKSATSVIGPGAPIRWDPAITQELDYEVEMGVIIGKKGIDISEDHAMQYVFGYTVVNDISARDLQRRHGQWFKGKSLDDTCPMGPCIVTSDQLADIPDLAIALRLNGATMQASRTGLMVFSVAGLISQLSQGMTLEPGDIIATGTPGGVGFARHPPVFLQEGDLLEAEIERIGVLTNRVARAERGL